jgi:NTP pyrophosphatase (non-canonical NTP hydrolase)
MMYYIYHIPGKKIGMTCDLQNRVTEQQGYEPHEYEVLAESKDVDFASWMELQLQKQFGYKVDRKPYNKLKSNNMRINVTEQTTTFPCPVNKLKGQLMDSIGMKWDTDHGEFSITENTIKWVLSNVKESMYNTDRCYIYNKAFARYYDNNDPYSGKTIAGGLFPTGADPRKSVLLHQCEYKHFDLIRGWAEERGLYDKGDPKTQLLKLVEEVGETCRAVLKENKDDAIDGIGDCVVVLTNLAELINTPIEECVDRAWNEIKNRKGKMNNGTFKKDE